MRSFIFILLLLLSISNGLVAQIGVIVGEAYKYGIFDENYGIVVSPECDEIISKPTEWDGKFFILRKGNKYAYTYFRQLDSLGRFSHPNPHWETSQFDYDELTVINDKTISNLLKFFTLQYKKEGKYGLIYARTQVSNLIGIGTRTRSFGEFGELYKTEAIYEEPFFYVDDKLLHVKLKGKYRLLEFVEDVKWINYTYSEAFDSIGIYPNFGKEIEIVSLIKEGSEIELLKILTDRYRLVKKNGKWGLIQVNPKEKSIEYLIPCVNEFPENIGCIPKASTKEIKAFYTKTLANDTIFIANTMVKYQSKLNIPSDPSKAWKVHLKDLTFYHDDYTHDRNRQHYLMVGLNRTGSTTVFDKIFLLDDKGEIKTSYNAPNVSYRLYKSNYGNFTSTRTSAGEKWICTFFDAETGKRIFSKAIDHNSDIMICKTQMGNKIPFVLSQEGKENIPFGYYNFEEKIFYEDIEKLTKLRFCKKY